MTIIVMNGVLQGSSFDLHGVLRLGEYFVHEQVFGYTSRVGLLVQVYQRLRAGMFTLAARKVHNKLSTNVISERTPLRLSVNQCIVWYRNVS